MVLLLVTSVPGVVGGVVVGVVRGAVVGVVEVVIGVVFGLGWEDGSIIVRGGVVSAGGSVGATDGFQIHANTSKEYTTTYR
jgi:hypothetical protein